MTRKHVAKRTLFAGTIATLAVASFATATLAHLHARNDAATSPPPASIPQVVVSRAQAAVDDARAQIRDAEFDVEHCRITALFTGLIGSHLVSVGNLIAGSRAATTPTTLLATMVSLDPIWLDFDMSESDFLAYSRDRARSKDSAANRVGIALGDETRFLRQGTLDFMDNVLNRSSGTIHVRATVPNPDRLLTPREFARVQLVVGAPVQALLF